MLSKEDIKVWENYISDLFSKPEEHFKISKSKIGIPTILDLHGLTIQAAFNKTNEFLEIHNSINSKDVTIITGKNGKINDELPYWCENHSFVKRCEPLFDSRGQYGAFIVTLKTIKNR